MHNPHVAAVEFKLLQIVDSGGLPVSAPCYYDESGALFPTPFIVVEYLEGSPEFAPADLHDLVDQLATTLARIHATPYSLPDLPFLPDAEQRVMRSLSDPPAVLDAAFDEGRIRATLVAVWPPARRNRPVVLHGDFWPGNLLWRDGRLVGVIDWEDAQTGDPLADLANSRLEMLWAYGPEAMQRFTEQYIILAQIDSSNLPYWDLAMALRPLAKFAGWAPDANAEQQMRERLQAFIKQAFERLA